MTVTSVTRWTPPFVTYAVMHIGALLGLLVLVGVGNVTWDQVKDPVYALVGLGIGLPLRLPDAKAL